jgi:hypothetical protein
MARLGIFLLLAAAGCGTLAKPVSTAGSCRNPCASLSCPSAFTCDVDAQCRARCVPEPPQVPR